MRKMLRSILLSCLVIITTTAAPNSNVNVDLDVNFGKGLSNNYMDLIGGPGDGRIKCGMETTAVEASKRIINGEIVNIPRKYSWQVGLYQVVPFPGAPDAYLRYSLACGGSIINDKFVLTAAHCLYNRDLPNRICKVLLDEFFVGIGSNTISDTVIFIEVADIFFNNFDCITFNNDIALLELKRPISILLATGYIRPICLPRDDTETFEGKAVIVSGWGSTIGFDPPPSTTPNPRRDNPDELREAMMPIISNLECSQVYSRLTDNMICASTENGFAADGNDTCNGDSGGPVSYKEATLHAQIGIVSFGNGGCGSKGNPKVFTRVTKFLPWIKIVAGKIYTLPISKTEK